jgi:hypothetical protein
VGREGGLAMKVLVDVPDSVGPELDRLRALVGNTNMTMRVLDDDAISSNSAPEKIVNHFNISVDGRQRLRVYGVLVDEGVDELLGQYVVIITQADDDRRTMGMLR